jgi:predicted Zn-dependent protease
VAGRPADGRPRQGRPSVPPPARPRGEAGVRTARAARPAGPLAARPDPGGRRSTSARARPGRLRRFVLRWGWRAYAIPVLVVATVAVLVDLAVHPPAPASSSTTAGATSASTVAPSTGAPEPTPVQLAPAEGDAEPSTPPETVGVESYVEQGAGTLAVVDGTSAVVGTGPLQRFIVEVEDGIQVDGTAFATAVEATLNDPRSWGNGGRYSFQRVGVAEALAGQFEFKVSLVSPGSMETYCPGVGTGGYTSCRYGDRAVINLARWATAVPDYEGDVATYRQYVVNHEVGHVLGNGHVDCPGPGQLAPVMQQQTLGLEGCVKNAWPYP